MVPHLPRKYPLLYTLVTFSWVNLLIFLDMLKSKKDTDFHHLLFHTNTEPIVCACGQDIGSLLWIYCVIYILSCTYYAKCNRDHFVYVSSQCQTTLHYNVVPHFVHAPSQLHCTVVSHWLAAYTKWSPCSTVYHTGQWFTRTGLCCQPLPCVCAQPMRDDVTL